MLKEILSVSGKSGLFKLVSQGNTMLIAESLIDHKRIPVSIRDKVVSLNDILIYTQSKEIPLREIFQQIKEKQGETAVDFNPSVLSGEELRSWFAEIVPDFDQKRVYPSDIKKIMTWYNLLLKEGLTNFEENKETKALKNTKTTRNTRNKL
jgi:hypothetical protein